ncbi:hypothetical protein [Acidiphilium acidophilum]|uniref:hypothetical protein n=1 Tax=Acidiphilium acidophilum TaxID=76588 RepID=UPI002E8E73DC|nr:hypothetical protein [Acidiphilium acidophilum]
MTALSVNSPIFINEIMMSGSRIKWLPAVMIQNDQKVIWFEPPEEQGAPLRLNMFINDQHQNKIIWIDNNVWHASSDSFDIKIVNKKSSLKIIVSNESGVPIVDINFFAPDTIVISKFISHFSDKSVEIGGSTDSGYINVNGRNMITGSNIYAGYGNIALNIG